MTTKTTKTTSQLRFDARLAFLDGRNARARQLNKQADALNRAASNKAKAAAA